jgi:prolyl-tRNA synthetase
MDPPAFVAAVQGLLGEVQDALLASATAFRNDNIVDVTSYEELKAAVAEGEGGAWGWGD